MANKNRKIVNNEIKEVFFYFLKLGALGFGGPLALVSNMQKDCVEKKWLTQHEFTSTFALIKAMPGPVAFMTSVFLGRRKAGFWGGLAAGVAINLPAFILMIIFSIFFTKLSHLSFMHSLMLGMQACALGVILGSLKGLVKGNERNASFWILVIIAGGINTIHPAYEPLVILAFGFLMITKGKLLDLGTMALVFFKAGALVFGSGLAIVPMLQYDVVKKYQWLSQSEFLDALAFGQLTPGPVVITATYIGQKMYGLPGAFIATFAIFAASFFHMSTWFPHVVKKLSGKIWIKDFIFGAVAAVVGPIIVAVYNLGNSLGFSLLVAALFVASFLLTLLTKFPLWAVIPLGGIVSLALQSF